MCTEEPTQPRIWKKGARKVKQDTVATKARQPRVWKKGTRKGSRPSTHPPPPLQ